MAKELEFLVEDVVDSSPEEVRSALDWEGFEEKKGEFTKRVSDGLDILIKVSGKKAPVFLYTMFSLENERMLPHAFREWSNIKYALWGLEQAKKAAAPRTGKRVKIEEPKEKFKDYEKRVKADKNAASPILHNYYKVTTKKAFHEFRPSKDQDELYLERIDSLLHSKYFKRFCHLISESARGTPIGGLNIAVNAFYHLVITPPKRLG